MLMSRSRSFSRSLGKLAGRANDGIAAVEFAILVPVFLILLMGTTDLGQMLYAYYKLDQAVAAGAEYAALNAANVTSTNGAALASSIATIVESANGSSWANDTIVVNNGPTVTVTSGTAVSSGTASSADSYYCLTGSPGSWSWGTANATQVACAGGGSAGKFVTVTATYSYHPVLKIYNFITDSTLSQSSVVETQ
ncbi:MAG TPA: TadE/TadG family type IV pilus assembly protein [Rhizomicrobium sp.]|jgi:Flp pilus assembly protein TadG|nr:TadE/TadG family type IV pilus assembly protein [Rhizomicrobium sp.]